MFMTSSNSQLLVAGRNVFPYGDKSGFGKHVISSWCYVILSTGPVMVGQDIGCGCENWRSMSVFVAETCFPAVQSHGKHQFPAPSAVNPCVFSRKHITNSLVIAFVVNSVGAEYH